MGYTGVGFEVYRGSLPGTAVVLRITNTANRVRAEPKIDPIASSWRGHQRVRDHASIWFPLTKRQCNRYRKCSTNLLTDCAGALAGRPRFPRMIAPFLGAADAPDHDPI